MADRLMMGIPLPGVRGPLRVCEMPGAMVILRRGYGRPGVGIGCVPCHGGRVMWRLAMGTCPVMRRSVILVIGLLRGLAHSLGVVASRFLRKGMALQQQLHFSQSMLRLFGVARENAGLNGYGAFFRCFSRFRGSHGGDRLVRMG